MAPSVQGPELAASKRALATGSSDESEDSVNILYRGDLRRVQRKKAGRKANIARAIGRSTEEATATVYEACIERNWGCRFRDSLPSKLRPTRRRTNGARSASKLGLIPATRPAEWSRKIKEALCELSRATPGNMAYAHDLLIMQVRQRQTTKAHPEHYAGEALTSDLRAVIVKVATLTKAGRYRPKKIANGVNKLHGVEQPSEAKDVYDEFSPEELAATTEHVSKDMVQERLEADRESQPLEGPWKHLRKQVSAQAAQQSNQHVSGSAYGRDSVRGSGAESGLRDAMQKAETASQIAEVYRRKYGALSRGD